MKKLQEAINKARDVNLQPFWHNKTIVAVPQEKRIDKPALKEYGISKNPKKQMEMSASDLSNIAGSLSIVTIVAYNPKEKAFGNLTKHGTIVDKDGFSMGFFSVKDWDLYSV